MFFFRNSLKNENELEGIRNMFQSGSPFGYNPTFKGLSPLKGTITIYATNPRELQAMLDTSEVSIDVKSDKKLKLIPVSSYQKV